VYIELHAASAFSFLQGASLPEALVERAAALGYPALALLDADGVYGAPRFHKAAQRAGLRAIIGAEISIGNAQRPTSNSQLPNLPLATCHFSWPLPRAIAICAVSSRG
jgi:error-prone DNA polymerase